MIEKMTKFTFLLPSSLKEEFIQALQERGVVDVTRRIVAVDERSTALLERSARIAQAREILSYIPDDAQAGSEPGPAPADCVEEVFALRERIKETDRRIENAAAQIKARTPWGDYSTAAISELEDLGYKVRYYRVPEKRFSAGWAAEHALQEISRSEGFVYFVTISDDPGYTFPYPETTPPAGPLEVAREDLARLEAYKKKQESRLAALRKALPAMEEEADGIRVELDHHFTSLAATSEVEGAVTVIEGFVPTEEAEAFGKWALTQPVYAIPEEARPSDAPPIKFRNNSYVKMFEVLTDMYGRPGYDGFDPTPFLSVFFMLFFAFCMGDAGYGLLLIIIGLLLKKVDSFKKFAPLVVALGIGTTVVGFVFHTFFSIDMAGWDFLPEGVRKCFLPAKIAGYDGTMVLAVAVGVLHLCLAMIIKTYVSTRNKGFGNSLGTWGWTLLVVGSVVALGLLLVGVLDKDLAKWVIIAIGVLSAAGIFLLNDLHRNPLKNIGAGLWDTYNTVTGLLGDVLSYLRLYALGLAGAMLGAAFNSIGQLVLGDGSNVVLWIPFVLIVVVGHALNIAMCALGAFVHPLRLNFLEFFKNSGYDPVGRPYNPLRPKAGKAS